MYLKGALAYWNLTYRARMPYLFCSSTYIDIKLNAILLITTTLSRNKHCTTVRMRKIQILCGS